MVHFVVTTEGMSVARLFRDNMWKLHRLLESIVSDRGPQFAVKLTRELNRMLVLLFICLVYVSLHALFVFDITFFPSGLISLHKIGLYISLHHNCSTDIQNIEVVCYED